MDDNTCYKIGYVIRTHGLKGEVTVSLDPGVSNSFQEIQSVFLDQKHQLVPFLIENISIHNDKAFIKFEDVNTVDQAERLKGSSIYLPKISRPKSGRGEFYDDEVIGFEVTDDTLGKLGLVNRVELAGVNRLLSVNFGGKEILIPINGPFIRSVNKSARKIKVALPEGFADI